MVRVKRGVIKQRKHKATLKATKGFEHTPGKLIRKANNVYWKAGASAFRGRRKRKGQMRQKWILRMNSALKQYGVSYSKFINALKAKKIALDRKSLSEVSIRFPEAFKHIVEFASK